MRPVNGYLILEKVEVSLTTESGIILNDSSAKKINRAKILATCADSQFKEGDEVIYTYADTSNVLGKEYLIAREEDIQVVL
jgi:co-chaperonin GroES (HSP10)